MQLHELMANLERFIKQVPLEAHAAFLASTITVSHLDGKVMGKVFDVCVTIDGELFIIVSAKE